MNSWYVARKQALQLWLKSSIVNEDYGSVQEDDSDSNHAIKSWLYPPGLIQMGAKVQ